MKTTERTQEEIQTQIKGLEAEKARLPEYSGLGTPNHAKIDIQLEILKGQVELDDIDEGDWDEMDEDNEVYRAAEEASEWLYSEREDDLFE